MNISSDLRKKLQEAGMNETQLSSKSLQIALEVLMGDDNLEAIKEADRQLKERKKLLGENSVVFHIAEDLTNITDERAKNAVKLYSAIYKMQSYYGSTDIPAATQTAEHVTCAYLGVKSFTTINAASVYDNDGDEDDEDDEVYY